MTTTTTEMTAEEMIADFKEGGVEPDHTFTAAAGRDYGQIEAWDIGNGKQAVKDGNNAETNYNIVDAGDWGDYQGENALEILSADDKSPLSVGTILGIDAVEAATEDDRGPFFIMSSRDYYGPTSEVSYETDEETGDPLEFGTLAEAQAWIDALSGPVYLSHNQSSGPAYKIVSE